MLPTPPSTSSCKLQASQGKSRLHQTGKYVEWKLNGIVGGQSAELRFSIATDGGVGAGSDVQLWSRPPCTVRFMVRGYSASGVQVQNVRVVEKAGYDVVPVIKVMTQAKDLQIKWWVSFIDEAISGVL